MHPPPALSVTCIKVQSGHILWAIPLGQKHWITHLISTNYTQTQSLIQAVDIEQPAVVNYFFTILSRKSSQASVGRRSVSSKSILPELWALTICFLKKKKKHSQSCNFVFNMNSLSHCQTQYVLNKWNVEAFGPGVSNRSEWNKDEAET